MSTPIGTNNCNINLNHYLEQEKPKEVLCLLEKGYMYGSSKVAVIICKSLIVTNELTELALKLEKAIKDKNVIDNSRYWAKTKTIWNLGSGAMNWRQYVNEL